MVLHDDHDLSPGQGFTEHDHRELEIVTWVLAGRLAHRHVSSLSGPADRSLGPGDVQHLSAGTGVRHAELAGDVATRFVQCWLLPSEPGRTPRHRVVPVRPDLPTKGCLEQVLDLPEGRLHVARLAPGDVADVPQAPYAHVFVAHGTTDLADEGDALHLTGEDRVRLTALTPAELLVWVLTDTRWKPDRAT